MTPEQRAYIFVLDIILSSRTSFHFAAADVLIDLFCKKFPDDITHRDKLIVKKKDVFNEIFPINNKNATQ